MIKTINVLQEERAALVSKDEERQYQTEELHENTKELQREAEKNDVKMQCIKCDVEEKDKLSEEKRQSTTKLEKELSHYKEGAVVSKTMVDHTQKILEETKSKLEASEAKYVDYRAEK